MKPPKQLPRTEEEQLEAALTWSRSDWGEAFSQHWKGETPKCESCRLPGLVFCPLGWHCFVRAEELFGELGTYEIVSEDGGRKVFRHRTCSR